MRPCGTDTAYRRHRSRGEEACEPCKAAHRERERARPKIRERASGRLRDLHRAEYGRLLAEEYERQDWIEHLRAHGLGEEYANAEASVDLLKAAHKRLYPRCVEAAVA